MLAVATFALAARLAAPALAADEAPSDPAATAADAAAVEALVRKHLAAPRPTKADYPDLRRRDVVTVLVLGDSGVAAGLGPVAQAAADVCFSGKGPACDLAVLVGDNVYEVGIETPGAAAWVDAFATPMAPFSSHAAGPARFRAWVVAGNHDWGHGTDAAGAGRVAAALATTDHPANAAIGGLWRYPALAYRVPGLPRWLNLHGVDTELIVRGKGAAVLDATAAAMKRTRGWDVVFGHHAPVTTGVHGRDDDERDDEVWAAALETLRPAGLSLVLAGHDHHQEVLESAGVPVIIQGNSSKGRDVGPTKYTPCSRWVRGGKPARGFAVASFREDRVDVTFYDAAGAPVHTAGWARAAGSGAAPPFGSCPAAPPAESPK